MQTMPRPKYNWHGVEEYVLRKGEIDYQDLSRRFDIPASSLRFRACTRKWRDKIEERKKSGFFSTSQKPSRDDIIGAVRTASAWDRIDASAGRLCEALLRQVMLNISVNGNRDDRPLDPRSLGSLVNSTATIINLARSIKGDVGQAIGVFTEAGLMPEDYAPQLLAAIEASDNALKDGLKKVFTGNIPD